MTPLELWLIFLRYADDVKRRDLVNQILNRREEITVAANVLREITQEEHMRAKRRSQRMWETDMANNYLEGIEVGEARGIKDMARKLKAVAILSNTQIAELSGLSIAEIEKL
jgi:galactokinase